MAMRETKADLIAGYIYETTNYDKFQRIKSNRETNKANLAKLQKSMEEEFLFQPIQVNENFEIIDGQHRFECCEYFKKPVSYFVSKGYYTSQMKRANLVSRNWTVDDFLYSFKQEGKIPYAELYEIKEKSGLNTSNLISLYAKIQKIQPSSASHLFKKGLFTLKEEEKKRINKFLVDLEDFKAFPSYKRSSFVAALLEMYFHEKYNHNQMKNRLLVKIDILVPCSNKNGYLELLANKIYSQGSSKNNIFFDAGRKKLYPN